MKGWENWKTATAENTVNRSLHVNYYCKISAGFFQRTTEKIAILHCVNFLMLSEKCQQRISISVINFSYFYHNVTFSIRENNRAGRNSCHYLVQHFTYSNKTEDQAISGISSMSCSAWEVEL